jgi:hypothetical protein
MCQAVLETVGTLEDAVAVKVSTDTPQNNTEITDLMSLKGRMYMIDQAYTCITKDRWYGHAGVWEFSYWAMQSVALIFVLSVVIFFFYEVLFYFSDS